MRDACSELQRVAKNHTKKLLITALVLLATSVSASTVIAPEAPITLKKPTYTLDELIHAKSIEYGVSEALVRHIVQNESRFNPLAEGDVNYVCPAYGASPGEISPSYGLVQINIKCWHPTVTYEQAIDPEFAITFLATNLAEGKCYLWSTCPL